MISAIRAIDATSVTVIDANGTDVRVPITLTPVRQFLTQSTKRSILATGFLLRYGEDAATDTDIIDSVISSIRSEVLASGTE